MVASAAWPDVVSRTTAAFMSAPSVRRTSTNPAAVASSQIGDRGHDVRQAFMVSPYVRGRAATHVRSSVIKLLIVSAIVR